MPEVVIQVENLSKYYHLGSVGTGTLRRDIQRWWKVNVKKEEDPLSIINEDKPADDNKKNPEDFYALKNVSFDVKHGEVIGIIGRNGAGKSTLLKIISRIIRPTSGIVRGRGKIGSLLEVGTGFHHELSGRENIYISGSILGMSKNDIRQKFDEIVAFSGIEKFIDTPVKRYSSGMYVRLAFSVAAHLEPDILIVDEVLAVGDADFQKKCLGKMKEVSSNDGRTILFVSHSMQAIQNLCSKAILLERGKILEMGPASSVVNKYLSSTKTSFMRQQFDDLSTAPGNEYLRIQSVELIPELADKASVIDVRTPLTFRFKFWNNADKVELNTNLLLFSQSGDCIFDLSSPLFNFGKGLIEGECRIPGNFLNDGSYYLSLIFVRDKGVQLFQFENCISFDVEDYRVNTTWYGKWWGAVRPQFPFTMHQLSLTNS
jgi:lipopolysaccharide transport system ATP-binding protein